MNTNTVGLGDLRFYVPRNALALADLVARRIAEKPELKRHLDRAIQTTGQRGLRFPRPYEDTATMAAEAALELLGAGDPGKVAGLRWIVTGTETGLDHSKPVSAYIQGMLAKAGLAVPTRLATFQTQHACAGGSLGMLTVAGMLAISRDPKDTGLVIASDISRYSLSSTAEITQGAGAAAMLVERDPRLLEFDPAVAGYASHDVDDFFRPLDSITAKVKGGYSMECYLQAFFEAWDDHVARLGVDRVAWLRGLDAVVLHTPFRNMPEIAMKRLLGRDLGMDEAGADRWLAEHSFFDSVDIIADIGNSYSASIFIFLANTLRALRKRFGADVVGKKILFASYGSGSVMTVFTATVARGAGDVIDSWNIDAVMGGARAATMEEYDRWTAGYSIGEDAVVAGGAAAGAAGGAGAAAGAGERRFGLRGIRADGYREYGY